MHEKGRRRINTHYMLRKYRNVHHAVIFELNDVPFRIGKHC